MKLTMCQGLPGSGKTTWAVRQVLSGSKSLTESSVCRVNKDDIRRELEAGGWEWSQEKEADVIKIRDSQIKNALHAGYDVISDDTNFGRKHKVRLAEIARKYGAEFVVQDFTKVPVDECLRRDEQRTGKARVGEAVIRKMAALYLEPAMSDDGGFDYSRFAPVVQPEDKPIAIICDLDGTLADFKTKGHRGPYDATLCDQDDIVWPVARLLTKYHYGYYKILLVSGREEKYREPTLDFVSRVCAGWLEQPQLWMRDTGDKRKDWIVKGEIFDREIRGKYYIDFVLDDRNQVVDFWRYLGLSCWQVAKGDF